MSSKDVHSEACCRIPPVVAKKEYKLQGKYETIGGRKTYVTGPATAIKALFVIYDVFAYWPQTLQGADILASHDGEHQHQVFMPDFLEGEAAEVSWYPPHDEYTTKMLGAFLSGPANPANNVAKVSKILEELKKYSPSIKSWGIVGYCWGGKLVSMSSGTETLFKAGAQCHPAFLDPQEALDISIPMFLLPSGDENLEDVKQYMANLKGPKRVETFSGMVHGWMSAKGDLEDPRKKAEFEMGYKLLLEFFAEYL